MTSNRIVVKLLILLKIGIMEKRNINIEVEKILNSTTRKEPVSPSPFFTNRVLHEIEQQGNKSSFRINWGYVLKPGIAALVALNLANYFLTNDIGVTEVAASDSEVLYTEYSYNSVAMTYYEEYLKTE